MKFIIDSAELKAACNAASRISPKVIGCIALTTTEPDGKLRLKTMGDSIYMEYELSAQVIEPGTVFIGIGALAVLSGFSGSIEMHTTAKQIIFDGNLHVAINPYGIDIATFDRSFDIPEAGWIRIDERYKRILHAAGDPKLIRDAMYFRDQWGFCLDGYRISGAIIAEEGGLPETNIRFDYLDRVSVGAETHIAVVGNRVWVRSGPMLTFFPTYTAKSTPIFDIMMGKAGHLKAACTISVSKEDILPVLQTLLYLSVSLEDKEGLIRLMFDGTNPIGTSLNISSDGGNQIGNGSGNIPATFKEGEHEKFDILISPRFLLDAIRQVQRDEVVMSSVSVEMGSGGNPGFVVYDDKVVHLIAPKVR